MTSARLRWLGSAGLVLVVLAIGRIGSEATARPSPGRDRAPEPPSWAPYHPADGSFRIVGPGPVDERSVATEGGLLHRAGFTSPSQIPWFVAWLDVAPGIAAGRSDADLVDLGAAPLADRLGAAIVEEDVLRDGGFPGVDLLLSTPSGRSYLVRIVAVRGRLIEAVAGWEHGEERIEAERFVRSLIVTVG